MKVQPPTSANGALKLGAIPPQRLFHHFQISCNLFAVGSCFRLFTQSIITFGFNFTSSRLCGNLKRPQMQTRESRYASLLRPTLQPRLSPLFLNSCCNLCNCGGFGLGISNCCWLCFRYLSKSLNSLHISVLSPVASTIKLVCAHRDRVVSVFQHERSQHGILLSASDKPMSSQASDL